MLSVVPFPRMESVEWHFLRHAFAGAALFDFDRIEVHDANGCQVAIGIEDEYRNVLFAGEYGCDWSSFLGRTCLEPQHGVSWFRAKLGDRIVKIPTSVGTAANGTLAFSIQISSLELSERLLVKTTCELASLMLGWPENGDHTRIPAIQRVDSGRVYYWSRDQT